MANIADALELSDEDRLALEALVSMGSTSQKLARRARIVLYAAEGWPNTQIADEVGVSRPTVGLWRGRFVEGGIPALARDATRPSRIPPIAPEVVDRIVHATLHETPRNATHWTCRTMAKVQGVSPSSVQRIWKAHHLQPHRVKTFKLSSDPDFVEKVRDVVGLYMNPPDKSIVFSVDEKSQIQALDRTRPILPIRPGVPACQTHDYKRNGTTTLFAGLNLLDGTVLRECMDRHTNKEFIRFLNLINRSVPDDLDVHVVVDNYGTHKHENVHKWLKRHKRFHLHFTPTGASWLNAIERVFADLTNDRIRRGTFNNVPELVQAIYEYIDTNNEDPRPFQWNATADDIINKVTRCKEALETGH